MLNNRVDWLPTKTREPVYEKGVEVTISSVGLISRVSTSLIKNILFYENCQVSSGRRGLKLAIDSFSLFVISSVFLGRRVVWFQFAFYTVLK